MPVIGNKPQGGPKQPAATLKITKDDYQGVTVDTRSPQALDSLATYLPGSAWDVDYYSQVLMRDSGTQSHQTGLSAAQQNYSKIRGFELRVTQPLTTDQDEQSGEFSRTGTALVYPTLTPNQGDVFVADAGNGREGVFQVNSVRRSSVYAEAALEITYSQLSFNNAEKQQELESKVVQTLFFDKQNLRNGREGLIRQDTVDQRRKLTTLFGQLLNLYLRDFFSTEHGTLIVPDQQETTYDPYLVRFVKFMFGYEDHPLIQRITELNVSQDPAAYEFTLWNALETLDVNGLIPVMQQMVLADVIRHFGRPQFNSIFFSGVRRVVYPKFPSNSNDMFFMGYQPRSTVPLRYGEARHSQLERVVLKLDLTQVDPTLPREQPLIHRVGADTDYYVFTRAFYEPQTTPDGLSVLETLTMQMLKREAVDTERLLTLAQQSFYFDDLDRFYYVPIILLLILQYPGGL